MRWTAVLLWLAACGGSHGVDGGSEDGGVDDGGEGDAPVASPCVLGPITSSEPLALVFSGSAPSTDYRGAPMPVIDETITLYFPDGTGEGARVIATHPVSWPYDGVATSETTIAGGYATFEASGSYRMQDFSVSGSLDLGSGAIGGSVYRNFAPPYTDVAEPGMGPITLCRVGPASVASAITGTPSATALSTLRLSPSVPLDTEVLSLLHEGGSVPFVTIVTMGVIELRTPQAWPMGPLTVAIDGADVMGDVPSLPAPITVARPTAVLTDLTLDTEPPDGAVVGEWREGALRAGIGGYGPVPYPSSTLTAALGAPPPSATSVRVTFVRSYFGYAPVRAAVVTEDGASSPLDLGEGSSPEPRESTASLPGPGPLYLVVVVDVLPPRPQTLPAYGHGGIDVTEIAFE